MIVYPLFDILLIFGTFLFHEYRNIKIITTINIICCTAKKPFEWCISTYVDVCYCWIQITFLYTKLDHGKIEKYKSTLNLLIWNLLYTVRKLMYPVGHLLFTHSVIYIFKVVKATLHGCTYVLIAVHCIGLTLETLDITYLVRLPTSFFS